MRPSGFQSHFHYLLAGSVFGELLNLSEASVLSDVKKKKKIGDSRHDF